MKLSGNPNIFDCNILNNTELKQYLFTKIIKGYIKAICNINKVVYKFWEKQFKYILKTLLLKIINII